MNLTIIEISYMWNQTVFVCTECILKCIFKIIQQTFAFSLKKLGGGCIHTLLYLFIFGCTWSSNGVKSSLTQTVVCDTSLQFNSILMLSLWRGDNIRFQWVRAQSHGSVPPHSHATCQVQVLTCASSNNPLLGFGWFVRAAPRTQRNIILTRLHVCWDFPGWWSGG